MQVTSRWSIGPHAKHRIVESNRNVLLLTIRDAVLQVRWALKHHGIKYKIIPYTPMIGEYWLRWKTGKWNGRVTTPVLLTADGERCTSFQYLKCPIAA